MYTYMYRMVVVGVVGLGLFLPFTASAGLFNTIEALEQSDDFALDPMFQSVGFVESARSDGTFLIGSGVLIDPYWVLTAGHVALDGGTNLLENPRFSLDNDFLTAAPGIAVDGVFVAPGYTDDLPAGVGNDLALLRLTDPILDVAPAVRFRGEDVSGTRFAGGIWSSRAFSRSRSC